MANDLPGFLKRVASQIRPALTLSDSAASPASAPVSGAATALQSTAESAAIGAQGQQAAGIFRSRPPVLLGTEAAAAQPAKPATAEAVLERVSAPQTALRGRLQPAGKTERTAKAAKPQRSSRTPSLIPEAPGGFRIVSLPRLAQGGRWRTEAMRAYSVPLLLWFTRGQGRITVAGVTRGFGAHNCLWLPPGTMHGFEVTAQVFGSALFFPRGIDLGLPDEPVHLRFRDAAGHNELTQMIDAMQRELDRALPARDRALHHHAGLLSVWLERQIEAQKSAADLAGSAAKRLSAAYAALVEQHFRDGATVAGLAADLGVTPAHLTRSCKAACGHSAHDILSDRIFYEARTLLRDTSVPVMEIARSLHFTSAAYFTRAFQKATGETPTAFRGQRRA